MNPPASHATSAGEPTEGSDDTLGCACGHVTAGQGNVLECLSHRRDGLEVFVIRDTCDLHDVSGYVLYEFCSVCLESYSWGPLFRCRLHQISPR